MTFQSCQPLEIRLEVEGSTQSLSCCCSCRSAPGSKHEGIRPPSSALDRISGIEKCSSQCCSHVFFSHRWMMCWSIRLQKDPCRTSQAMEVPCAGLSVAVTICHAACHIDAGDRLPGRILRAAERVRMDEVIGSCCLSHSCFDLEPG